MDAPWGCSAAYSYALYLPPSLRAWEYLRRNPRYLRDWRRRRSGSSAAAHWGLAALIDPRLDAREASPIWTIDALRPVTLARDEMHRVQERPNVAERFSLWRLSGRKSLFDDGNALRLIVRSLSGEVQMRMSGDLGDGDRFAFQISPAADDRAASAALRGFGALIRVSRNGWEPALERPGRADLFHLRALQVLDGLAAGASQRELAIAIFGSAAVERGWQPDGALRAQVRYLIGRARALMAGEYRSLITAGRADCSLPRMARHGGQAATHGV
jgi:hypothetical protein